MRLLVSSDIALVHCAPKCFISLILRNIQCKLARVPTFLEKTPSLHILESFHLGLQPTGLLETVTNSEGVSADDVVDRNNER